MIRITTCLIIFLLTWSAIKAQPFYFRHYQVENGLSHNSVFCSIQDKNGFLWFGTKDGLNRFDGYHFKLFNIVADNENSLSKDMITSLALDEKGVVWVGSQKGLYYFDAIKERLVPFIDSLSFISELFFDKSGQLWIIAGNTACRYNYASKTLTTFPPTSFFHASAICQTEDGNLWFATEDGLLVRFNEQSEKIKRFDVFAHSDPAASRKIEKIIPGVHNTIIVGTTSRGVKLFDLANNTYKDLLLTNPDKTSIYVRDIIKAGENEFWFATESGIFIYRTGSGQFQNIRKKYQDPYSLSDNAVYCLAKDSEGGIWAGTYFGGVNYYPKQYSVFQKYFPNYDKNAIGGSVVREICEDSYGNLWIGTEDAGLNKWNKKKGTFTHFMPSEKGNSIAYTNIHGLLVVGNELWIGTFEHGLDIMDIRTGRIKKRYKTGPGPNQLKSNFIVSLLQTKDGSIYVGTSNSLSRYRPATGDFLQIDEVPMGTLISCLLEAQDGTIWIGTHNRGVFYLNPKTNKGGHLQNNPSDKNSLTTNTINAIFQDHASRIWFATEGGGLCRLDNSTQSFERYTTKNGLPSNFVFKVLEDNNHTLWVTTSKGLVNIKDEKITVYTQANGLLNDQFNYNSGYKDASGAMYFGSLKGMIRFMPENFQQRSFVPPVYITGFQINNKELEITSDSSITNRSITFTDNITLPHNQSSFSIDFSALSFTSPEMTEFKYLMEGLDKNWTYLRTNRKVYFTNLSPGKYTFRVQAALNGNWSTQERTLAITILPPIWATPLAYASYIILSLLLLYYLFKAYQDKLEAKKERELYEAKMDFFTKVTHEIKTPLTLIKGPLENLTEIMDDLPQIEDDVKMMDRNTDRLLQLIDQILDFRKTETKGFSLDFTKVNLITLLKETHLNFQPAAKKKQLQFELDLPVKELVISADAEALQKIFSNLFSNAVKYADKWAEVKLLPDLQTGTLLIFFRNDGHTIPEEMSERIFEPFFRLKETSRPKGTGIGLSLARSLAELHGGKLNLSPSEKRCNTFILSLPMATDRIPVQENKRKSLLEKI